MTDPSAQPEHDLILSFKNKTVRAIMFDGVPWFVVLDLCHAMGVWHKCADEVNKPEFPEHAKRICSEVTDEGLQDIVAVSPVGAWWFTELVDPGRGQNLAAWTRREAKRLCPEPREGDSAMFLKLSPDHQLPPRPLRYSGRYTEWDELRWSKEYMNRPVPDRRKIQQQLLEEAEVRHFNAQEKVVR